MQVQQFLRDRGVPFEEHRHAPAYTAQGLARAEHVSGYAVAKPVVVKGDRGYAMCVTPAPKRVELSRAALALGETHVELASEQELAQLFGDCELGAEPPIGELFGLPTLMDADLERCEYVVMQAGTHTDAIRVKRREWAQACHAQVAPIASA